MKISELINYSTKMCENSIELYSFTNSLFTKALVTEKIATFASNMKGA